MISLFRQFHNSIHPNEKNNFWYPLSPLSFQGVPTQQNCICWANIVTISWLGVGKSTNDVWGKNTEQPILLHMVVLLVDKFMSEVFALQTSWAFIFTLHHDLEIHFVQWLLSDHVDAPIISCPLVIPSYTNKSFQLSPLLSLHLYHLHLPSFKDVSPNFLVSLWTTF